MDFGNDFEQSCNNTQEVEELWRGDKGLFEGDSSKSDECEYIFCTCVYLSYYR